MPLGPLRVLGSRVVDGSAEANAARVGAACRAAVWNEAAGGDRPLQRKTPAICARERNTTGASRRPRGPAFSA